MNENQSLHRHAMRIKPELQRLLSNSAIIASNHSQPVLDLLNNDQASPENVVTALRITITNHTNLRRLCFFLFLLPQERRDIFENLIRDLDNQFYNQVQQEIRTQKRIIDQLFQLSSKLKFFFEKMHYAYSFPSFYYILGLISELLGYNETALGMYELFLKGENIDLLYSKDFVLHAYKRKLSLEQKIQNYDATAKTIVKILELEPDNKQVINLAKGLNSNAAHNVWHTPEAKYNNEEIYRQTTRALIKAGMAQEITSNLPQPSKWGNNRKKHVFLFKNGKIAPYRIAIDLFIENNLFNEALELLNQFFENFGPYQETDLYASPCFLGSEEGTSKMIFLEDTEKFIDILSKNTNSLNASSLEKLEALRTKHHKHTSYHKTKSSDTSKSTAKLYNEAEKVMRNWGTDNFASAVKELFSELNKTFASSTSKHTETPDTTAISQQKTDHSSSAIHENFNWKKHQTPEVINAMAYTQYQNSSTQNTCPATPPTSIIPPANAQADNAGMTAAIGTVATPLAAVSVWSAGFWPIATGVAAMTTSLGIFYGASKCVQYFRGGRAGTQEQTENTTQSNARPGM
jgi:tetratricopeptide (TPR) repeat protein